MDKVNEREKTVPAKRSETPRRGKHIKAKKFMVSSMQVARLLDSSKFKEAGINNVRSNFKMKYLTIEINEGRYIDELLKVDKLGDCKIQCSQLVSHVEVKGVIGPIGVYNTEEEIKH